MVIKLYAFESFEHIIGQFSLIHLFNKILFFNRLWILRLECLLSEKICLVFIKATLEYCCPFNGMGSRCSHYGFVSYNWSGLFSLCFCFPLLYFRLLYYCIAALGSQPLIIELISCLWRSFVVIISISRPLLLIMIPRWWPLVIKSLWRWLLFFEAIYFLWRCLLVGSHRRLVINSILGLDILEVPLGLSI